MTEKSRNNNNSTNNTNEDDHLKNTSHRKQQPYYHPNYPISTVMNQVSSQNITSAAFNSIRSSIPINLKPPPLSSFVKLPYGTKQSSVLAPSHKRSAPTPIKLSPSPVIPLSDFDSYLQEVQAEFDRWKNNTDSNPQLLNSKLTAEPLLDRIQNSQHISASAAERSQDLPSLSVIPGVFFDRKFSLNDPLTFDRLTQPPQPSSSTSHSSESKLNSTQLQTRKSSPSIADLTTDHILLDKLSHYLDLIEIHLVQEISLRSSSFFSALGNLQSLHAQTSESVAQIEALKEQLDQLKQTVADKALNIIRVGIRRRNITNVELALTKINHVSQTIQGVEQLIQSGEWHPALGLIEDLEQLWHSNVPLSSGTPDQSTDSNLSSPSPSHPQVKFRLSKIKALSSLPKRLSVLRSTISRALEAELSSILSHDLKINLVGFANAHKAQPNSNQSPTFIHSLSSNLPVSQSDDHMKSVAKERLKERIRATFNGLIRADGMEKGLAAWREGVIKHIRNIVKETISDVIEGDLDDNDDEFDISQFSSKDKRNTMSEKTMTLTRNLKALKHADFLKIAEETYSNLLGCIEIVDTQSQALLELAGELKSQSISSDLPFGSNSTNALDDNPQSEHEAAETAGAIGVDSLSLKLNETVQASAELANARFAKVIGVRTEVHAQMSFTDFFAIFDASWRFVIQCEVISRRMIIALRGVMVSQAKAFLQSFHQSKITESAKIVEQEQWTPVEVPSRIQETVNIIISSAVEDPVSLIVTYNIPNPVPTQAAVDSTQSSKLLEIEGTFYHPVSAGLETLNTIVDYLRIVVNCSLLTTDLMGKIIEFLKAFNSRICQVVLGAGAIRSAGLKNITAKHLALASQALSTMVSLIPYVRECLRRHLNMKQAVMLVDFDKLKRDYQEHQNEVHSKLISIMADRLAVHKQTLQSIDWEKLDDSTSDQDINPNTYLESLLKEVGTLHRVLGRYLSSSTLQYIMSQVFSAINAALVEEFGRIEIQSTHGRNKLLRDAQYFSSKLIELKASEECQTDAKALEDLVQCRFFPKEPTADVTSPENRKNSTSEISSPISPLAERTESFRSKFRFLSPGRNLPPPLIAGVTQSEDLSSSLGENLPTSTSPVGSFTEVGTGGSQSQPQANGLEIVDDKNETADEKKATQETQAESKTPAKDINLDPTDNPQHGTIIPETESLSLTSLNENTSSAPLPSRSEDPLTAPSASLSPQPPKLTLSQRLAALALSRRGSQVISSSISPANNVLHPSPAPDPTRSQSSEETLTVTVPAASTPPVSNIEEAETLNGPVQDKLHENVNTSIKPQAATRLSFKERLAAIAAKAASNTSSRKAAPNHHTPEQSNTGGEESRKLESNQCIDASNEMHANSGVIIDKESETKQEVLPSITVVDQASLTFLEQSKLLPALPCSPKFLVTTEEKVSEVGSGIKSAEIEEQVALGQKRYGRDSNYEVTEDEGQDIEGNRLNHEAKEEGQDIEGNQLIMGNHEDGREESSTKAALDIVEDEDGTNEELKFEGLTAENSTGQKEPEQLEYEQPISHEHHISEVSQDSNNVVDKQDIQLDNKHSSGFETQNDERYLI